MSYAFVSKFSDDPEARKIKFVEEITGREKLSVL